jgi:hypothetical protein
MKGIARNKTHEINGRVSKDRYNLTKTVKQSFY